ncbi:MAG: alpha/beta fold hydrolase, partial [Alphaproteobacteria bacterium]|nr:alpha/beta fold hydrolase [Alphaproteobacteria bacterium]
MRIDFWKKWLEPKPYNQGYLPADGGHEVFFQEFGNPSGKPILVFHGGPGGSFKAKHVSFADLKKHRVVGFDQRGCGQSKPLGDMRNNNTQELLKDASRLLDYLHIEGKVVVRGGSWGSTLALLFAEAYPQKVEKLLLSQVFLADQTAAEWEFSGLKAFYPEFVDELKQKAGSRGIRTFFAEEINSGDLR